MRKKYLPLLVSALLAPMTAFAADGDVFTYNNLRYKVLSETDKTCEVSDNTGTTGVVVIPETAENEGTVYKVTEIGASAFAACRNMDGITLPQTITAIRERALENCSGLKTLIIPNSVTIIEYRGVFGCSGLTTLSISEGLTEIAPSTFSGCYGLTTLTIPDGIEKIGEEAFNFCNSLTSINLGKGLKEIDLYSFSGCIRLKSVTFPASMTTVGRRAFSYCERLTDVTIEEGEGSLVFGEEVFGERAYKDSWAPIERIVINRNFSCTSTEPKFLPFAQLTTLTSVEFGSSITNIGANSFTGCSKLGTIDVKAAVPPSMPASSFDTYSYNNAAVRVPNQSLSAYKEHNVWRQFKDITGEDWPGIIEYSLEITPDKVEIKAGETATLTVNITPEVEGATVVWTSSAPQIALVDENGIVSGIAEGTATITAEVTIPDVAEPLKAECEVTITKLNAVDSITWSNDCTLYVFRTDGTLAMKGTAEQLTSLEAGTYIVRDCEGVRKIVLK